MKIRKDFVTNSSSSSFIIGKKDETNITIESVYQMIRRWYKELLSNREALVERIKKEPKLNLEYYVSDDGRYTGFRFLKGNAWDDSNNEIDDMIEMEYGFSVWETFKPEYDWLKLETYEEYERYWMNKMEAAKDYGVHAPFTIADFLETRMVNWLHYYSPEYQSSVHEINSESDTLGWYCMCAEDAFKDSNCNEKYEYCDWCGFEECKHKMSYFKENNIPEEQACLYLLGRVCVHSESGYLPEYVVKKLYDVSEYGCNHMG